MIDKARELFSSFLTVHLLWALTLVVLSGASLEGAVLVGRGADWAYLDDGSSPGASWKEIDFDDAHRAVGAAELGMGDGDEATLIDGGSAGAPVVTIYFRHRFQITDASAITNLELHVKVDDGVLVYLNGVLVYVQNMPVGAIDSETPAAAMSPR